ncbi:MAG: hypothetical protein MJE77_20730 [Proteobacteria bacterium]|nr:hypothetical protein [Pseudomonadota bacterium]
MKLLTAAILSVSLAMTSYAFACPDKDKAQAKSADTGISVDEAAALLKQGKVIMVDANSNKTRSTEGYVPGARLLTSFNKFKSSELKAEKSDTLVFYCYNESCGAAPAAAKKAGKKGYKTRVMHGGIMGWKQAGHAVAKL